jgi:hypothetical protein
MGINKDSSRHVLAGRREKDGRVTNVTGGEGDDWQRQKKKAIPEDGWWMPMTI